MTSKYFITYNNMQPAICDNVCRNSYFFCSLIAESSPLPIAEQPCFQILGHQSESGCLDTKGTSKIKIQVLDN